MAAKKTAKKKKAAKKKTGAAHSKQAAAPKKHKKKKASAKGKAWAKKMAKAREAAAAEREHTAPKKKHKKKAKKAASRAPTHSTPKKKKKAKKARSITVAGVSRKKTAGGKTRSVPSTINIRVSAPHNVPKKKKKAKSRKGHSHAPKKNPIYAMENPLSGGELALAVVTGTVGWMLADVVDRIMATNAATTQTTTPVLDNTIAVLSPPNWKRMAASAGFALVPFALTLLPQVKESGMATAALQGAGLGALLNFAGRLVTTMVVPALLKNNTTYGPRMYGPEIAASNAAAALSTTPYAAPTAIPAPGTITGLPGLGAFRALQQPRSQQYRDRGPVARGALGATDMAPGYGKGLTSVPMTPQPTPVPAFPPSGCGPSGNAVADAAAQAYYMSQQIAAQNMIAELQARGAGSTVPPDTGDKENCGCGTLGMTPGEMFPDD